MPATCECECPAEKFVHRLLFPSFPPTPKHRIHKMADMGTNVSFRDNLRNDGILVSNNPGTINVHTSDPGESPTR